MTSRATYSRTPGAPGKVRAASSLVLVLLSVTVLTACTVRETATTAEPAPEKPKAQNETGEPPAGPPEPLIVPDGPEKIIVYYFHATMRCQACLDIEQYARETTFENLSELMSGTMEWRSVNYEVPENTHYMSDFQLSMPSLVLVRAMGGFPAEHKVLHETWNLIEDDESLVAYVRGQLHAFMGEELP